VTQVEQEPVKQVDGQSDHGIVLASDQTRELGVALDSVGARLVEGLAAGNVSPDLGRAEYINTYSTGGGAAGAAARGCDHGDGADHGMLATTEAPQHQGRVIGARRLAQALAIQHDHGVAPDHPLVRAPTVDFIGLASCRGQGLASCWQGTDFGLVERGGLDLEIDVALLEQLTAALRCRGQRQPRRFQAQKRR
jgi:hypothetical protein